MVSVIVNQWLGDGPKYPNCYCWSCRKPATVAEIADPGGALLVRLCGTCLHDALVSIHEAILEHCRLQGRDPIGSLPGIDFCEYDRTDGDDDGYPD